MNNKLPFIIVCGVNVHTLCVPFGASGITNFRWFAVWRRRLPTSPWRQRGGEAVPAPRLPVPGAAGAGHVLLPHVRVLRSAEEQQPGARGSPAFHGNVCVLKMCMSVYLPVNVCIRHFQISDFYVFLRFLNHGRSKGDPGIKWGAKPKI